MCKFLFSGARPPIELNGNRLVNRKQWAHVSNKQPPPRHPDEQLKLPVSQVSQGATTTISASRLTGGSIVVESKSASLVQSHSEGDLATSSKDDANLGEASTAATRSGQQLQQLSASTSESSGLGVKRRIAPMLVSSSLTTMPIPIQERIGSQEPYQPIQQDQQQPP